MTTVKPNPEFERFDSVVRKVPSVPRKPKHR
jgi:hypothetical protein